MRLSPQARRRNKLILAGLLAFGIGLFHLPILRAIHPDSLDRRLKLETWLIDHHLRGNPVVLSQLVPMNWDHVIVFQPRSYGSFTLAQSMFKKIYKIPSPLTTDAERDLQYLIFMRRGRVVQVADHSGDAGRFIARREPISRDRAIFTYFHHPITREALFGQRTLD